MTLNELFAMVDLTAVAPSTTVQDVERLAEDAARYACAAVYTLPSFTQLAVELLRAHSGVRIGGAVGFPSGATTTRAKAFEMQELLELGCEEFDMVINFGMLRSGREEFVVDEIRRLKEVAGDRVLKVILECHYLSEDEIKRGSELCREGGADYVKTSTGWAPTGATVRAVEIIKSVVGDDLGVKAAGGIRSLSTVEALYAAGARRFGLGVSSAAKLVEESR